MYIYIYLKYISDTFSKKTTAQSLLHVVIKLNGFLERVSLQDVNDRSESLALHDLGVGRQAGNDRRLDVVARPMYLLTTELDRTTSCYGFFNCRLRGEVISLDRCLYNCLIIIAQSGILMVSIKH